MQKYAKCVCACARMCDSLCVGARECVYVREREREREIVSECTCVCTSAHTCTELEIIFLDTT